MIYNGTEYSNEHEARRASVHEFLTGCGKEDPQEVLETLQEDLDSLVEECIHVGWEIPGIEKGAMEEVEELFLDWIWEMENQEAK